MESVLLGGEHGVFNADWLIVSLRLPRLRDLNATLPETNSSPLTIGRAPKGNSSSNPSVSGAMSVSGRVKASLPG